MYMRPVPFACHAAVPEDAWPAPCPTLLPRPYAVERQQFEKLALEHLDAVYRMAMQLSRHPDEAADLVQETYLKALKASGGFIEQGGGIRPWLFKILHNV